MGGVPTAPHRFEVLGPLAVQVEGQPVRLGGPRQRSVLALLLLSSGQVVPADRLIDEVWEGHPPKAAESTLRGYVWHLRKALLVPGTPLSASPLGTRPSGYQLAVAPDQLDAVRFEHRLAEGRELLRTGNAPAALERLRAALALWRGPALADLAAQTWARGYCAGLDEMRLTAIETRVEAELAVGRHTELVSELSALVAEHPLRERLHAHRMLALYRSGRQAEALDAYRAAYEVLADGRGIEPGAVLRDLHAAILRQDPQLSGRPAEAVATPPATAGRSHAAGARGWQPGPTPAELPPDMPTFTGRAGPLAQLDALLTGPEAAGRAVVISAIAGGGGVGKTALAVHWAHRVRHRFPDGQLHVDLRGYAPGAPVKPIEALARFLRTLGLPAEQVPVDVDEAAARYRSLLADRRMLVVLDNAASADQVRPLLPASRGCVVVVTSRDRLAGLAARDGAVRLALDVLTPDEATALLARLLGAQRVTAEPDASAELARLCANLPLALRIAAANLSDHPRQSISEFVQTLRAGDRLTALEAHGDEQSAVRNAFDLSYAKLGQRERRLFRLLGLAPGADFTAAIAGALMDAPPAETRSLLDRLSSAYLVTAQADNRYNFHDLLRLYAHEQVRAEEPEQDRRAALGRLLDYYRSGVRAATAAAFPAERRGDPEGSDMSLTAGPARAWLDAERVNLLAVIEQAATDGWSEHACDLAVTLWPYYVNIPHLADALSANSHALHAARAARDRAAEADALTNLGAACWKTGKPVAAQDYLEQALALRHEVGDRSGEAWTLNNLGSVHWSCGRYRRFFEHAERALVIFRDLGDRNGEVIALINLGEVYGRVGQYQRGVDQLREAAEIARATDHSAAESGAIEALSLVYWWWGRHDEAFDTAREAVAIARRIDARDDESAARTILALVAAARGQLVDARQQAERALGLAVETGIPRRETVALNALGEVLRAAGRFDEALARHRAALSLARDTNDRDEQARALDGAARALGGAGDAERAREYWQEALCIYTDLEVPDADRVSAILLTPTQRSG